MPIFVSLWNRIHWTFSFFTKFGTDNYAGELYHQPNFTKNRFNRQRSTWVKCYLLYPFAYFVSIKQSVGPMLTHYSFNDTLSMICLFGSKFHSTLIIGEKFNLNAVCLSQCMPPHCMCWGMYRVGQNKLNYCAKLHCTNSRSAVFYLFCCIFDSTCTQHCTPEKLCL